MRYIIQRYESDTGRGHSGWCTYVPQTMTWQASVGLRHDRGQHPALGEAVGYATVEEAYTALDAILTLVPPKKGESRYWRDQRLANEYRVLVVARVERPCEEEG